MVGFGVGLGYTASIVAVGQYFERRRPLALGIAFMGAVLSGVTLNPLFTYTQEYAAFYWFIGLFWRFFEWQKQT